VPGQPLREYPPQAGWTAPPPTAVLAAVGQPAVPSRRAVWPAGLSEREVEVLRLIARGRTNT
jgi:DNA-binding NarL/FixJ family response regulator